MLISLIRLLILVVAVPRLSSILLVWVVRLPLVRVLWHLVLLVHDSRAGIVTETIWLDIRRLKDISELLNVLLVV